MLDAGLLVLLQGELLQHAVSLGFKLTKHIVQKLVSLKLKSVTAPSVPWGFVQVAELGLALVKLVEVSVLKSNAGVRLVDIDAEFILNVLHSQVLSERTELIIDVLIVRRLTAPFLHEHGQSFS